MKGERRMENKESVEGWKGEEEGEKNRRREKGIRNVDMRGYETARTVRVKEMMNLIYVNAMRVPKFVRSPFYIFAPLIGRRYQNFFIHHICSIIGHAKTRR